MTWKRSWNIIISSANTFFFWFGLWISAAADWQVYQGSEPALLGECLHGGRSVWLGVNAHKSWPLPCHVPPKSRYEKWLTDQNRLSSPERGWNTTCVFCSHTENHVQHINGSTAAAKQLNLGIKNRWKCGFEYIHNKEIRPQNILLL